MQDLLQTLGRQHENTDYDLVIAALTDEIQERKEKEDELIRQLEESRKEKEIILREMSMIKSDAEKLKSILEHSGVKNIPINRDEVVKVTSYQDFKVLADKEWAITAFQKTVMKEGNPTKCNPGEDLAVWINTEKKIGMKNYRAPLCSNEIYKRKANPVVADLVEELQKTVDANVNTKREVKEITNRIRRQVDNLNKESVKTFLENNKWDKLEKVRLDVDIQTEVIGPNQDIYVDKNIQTIQWTKDGKERINNIDHVNSFEEWKMIAYGHPLDNTRGAISIWVNSKEVEEDSGLQKMLKTKYPELEETRNEIEVLEKELVTRINKRETKNSTKVIKIIYDENEQNIWIKLEKLKEETKEDQTITIHKLKAITIQQQRKMAECIFKGTKKTMDKKRVCVPPVDSDDSCLDDSDDDPDFVEELESFSADSDTGSDYITDSETEKISSNNQTQRRKTKIQWTHVLPENSAKVKPVWLNKLEYEIEKHTKDFEMLCEINNNTKREIKEVMIKLRRQTEVLKRDSIKQLLGDIKYEKIEKITFDTDTQTEDLKELHERPEKSTQTIVRDQEGNEKIIELE
ncbi:hypothetical protein RN001_003730 [Aquatica leii]|uniref:Uncharacterized protein n=1 Tax=Aquatica leii TaxID=1421715 RepID=A0AAN7SMG6_9COLE|nr:hypothetical protein RN001_003730 [Aquatica leii]